MDRHIPCIPIDKNLPPNKRTEFVFVSRLARSAARTKQIATFTTSIKGNSRLMRGSHRSDVEKRVASSVPLSVTVGKIAANQSRKLPGKQRPPIKSHKIPRSGRTLRPRLVISTGRNSQPVLSQHGVTKFLLVTARGKKKFVGMINYSSVRVNSATPPGNGETAFPGIGDEFCVTEHETEAEMMRWYEAFRENQLRRTSLNYFSIISCFLEQYCRLFFAGNHQLDFSFIYIPLTQSEKEN